MRIFISHSAHTERAASTLRLVRARLDGGEHDVFVDADLLAGDLWRSALYHELAGCQAAVVLLDRSSLASRWVQREMDVLLWRRAFDPALFILPVLLDDVTAEDVLDRGFAELTDHEFVEGGDLGPAAVAQLVADRFAAQPAPPGAGTAMEQWFDDLETVLGRIGDRAKLREAALALGVSAEDADQVLLEGGLRFLAHQFIGRSADPATVNAVRRLLYTADTDTLGKLAALIAPTWVDQSASRPLKVGDAGPRLVAVLNARDFRTAEHYIHRATCLDSTVRIEQVVAVVGEDATDELHAQCEAAVLHLLGGAPPFDTLADVPPDWVRDGPPEPAYLIVNTSGLPSAVVSEAVERIRDAYGWLVVILIVGIDPPPADRWELPGTRVLEPALEPHEEFKAQRTVRNLYQMIKKSGGEAMRE